MTPSREERRFRLVALAEGTSLLLLIAVALPLKHVLGIPIVSRVLGPIHGLFFLLYQAAVAEAWGSRRWTGKRALLCALAAIVPLGSFVAARATSGTPPRSPGGAGSAGPEPRSPDNPG